LRSLRIRVKSIGNMGLSGSIFRHTVIYSAATVLGRLVSFIMLPFYAHIFRAEGYGVIGMIDTSLGILTVLLTGGFQTAILRIYHEQEEDRKPLALGTGIRLVWLLGSLLAALPLVFSVPLSRFILGSSEYSPLFCLALVTFVIDVAGQSASTIQIIRQQSLLFSLIGILRLVLGLSLNIWLVIYLQIGLIGIFISSFVSASVGAMAFHWVAFKKHGLGFDRELCLQLLRFQLPLLPGDIISFLGRQAERILVRALIGLDGMGVLEMAYKFPPLLNYFINIPFQRAWRTKSLEIAEQRDGPQLMSVMFTRYLFMMTFAGLIMAATIDGVLKMVTPSDFWPAITIVRIEVVTTVLSGCAGYLSFGFLQSKHTKDLSIIRSALTPIKIGLGFIFISLWGLSGAAYSALVIEMISFIWLGSKAQKLYPIPLEYGKLIAIIASAGMLFVMIDGAGHVEIRSMEYLRVALMSPIESLLQLLSFAGWSSGRFLEIFHSRQEQIVTVILNSLFCMFFLALLPILRNSKPTATPISERSCTKGAVIRSTGEHQP
jgi:O-antigen/teichoic acid export membrane protein